MQEAPAGGKGQGVATVPEQMEDTTPGWAGGRWQFGKPWAVCSLHELRDWVSGDSSVRVCPKKPEFSDGTKQGRKKAV